MWHNVVAIYSLGSIVIYPYFENRNDKWSYDDNLRCSLVKGTCYCVDNSSEQNGLLLNTFALVRIWWTHVEIQEFKINRSWTLINIV